MIRYLIRNVENMECLVGVDIDEELLKENAFRIQPLLCDWLEIRETPFTVGIYQGKVKYYQSSFIYSVFIHAFSLSFHFFTLYFKLSIVYFFNHSFF